jgi:hypothetical protein
MTKPKSNTQNVPITKETHQLLVAHVQVVDRRIWKFADEAIREKLEREAKKKTH